MARRSQSPKKRQRVYDDQISEANFTELSSDIPILSRPPPSISSTPRRSISPTRDLLNDLRAGTPAILCELPFAIDGFPEQVLELQKKLSDRLKEGVIPSSLKDRILKSSPLAPLIPDHNYFTSTMNTQELDDLWDAIQRVLNKARDCDRYQKDENAWCSEVVSRLLELASARSVLEVENVQSHQINQDYLPRTANEARFPKKADYAFSFSRSEPPIFKLYTKLQRSGYGNSLSHTTDANTKRLALFSGIEVKPENGGKMDALVQLATWFAAEFEHLRKLGEMSRSEYLCDSLRPVVGWTIIGHDWHTYIAYRSLNENSHETQFVVGPWRDLVADTRDIVGIFRVFWLLKMAIEYATETFWPWLRKDILEPLAKEAV